MSEQQKNNILKHAKGSWQQEIVCNLISCSSIRNPVSNLKGNAKKYSGKYQASFNSLLSRLEKAGYIITIELGPRGGRWGAYYSLIN
jgi:DNA-binding transcriptional ArsR family regulator